MEVLSANSHTTSEVGCSVTGCLGLGGRNLLCFMVALILLAFNRYLVRLGGRQNSSYILVACSRRLYFI